MILSHYALCLTLPLTRQSPIYQIIALMRPIAPAAKWPVNLHCPQLLRDWLHSLYIDGHVLVSIVFDFFK